MNKNTNIKIYLWITRFLISLLSILAFASITILLYRIFDPNTLNNDINEFRDWILQNQQFHWILACYQKLKHLAHSADGSLEPLAYFISLTGFINFALSAIDTLVAKRTFGILLLDVVDTYFPHYQALQFWFHLFFYIIGGYACKIGYGQVAAFCAIGMFVCFVHALIMYGTLHLSIHLREKVVMHYIRKTRQSNVFNNLNSERAHLHDFVDYLSQQWRDDSTTQIYGTPSFSLENELILSLAHLLKNHLSDVNIKGKIIYIPDAFFTYFKFPSNFSGNFASYVLHTQMPPCASSNLDTFADFRYCAQECHLVWEKLLSGDDHSLWKARLAGRILMVSISEDARLFAPLVWGLLLHLNLSCSNLVDGSSPNLYKAHLTKQLDFLHQIVTEYTTTYAQSMSNKQMQEFITVWGQIVYLATGIIQWTSSLLRIPSDIGSWAVHAFTRKFKTMMITEKAMYYINRDTDSYLANAYLLFSIENPDLSDNLTAYTFLRLLTEIRKKMQISIYDSIL